MTSAAPIRRIARRTAELGPRWATRHAGFAGGAAGVLAKLRGGMRGGGKVALIAGAVYVVAVGSVWTAQTVDGWRKRRRALAELATMELPGEVLDTLQQQLTHEMARVVEKRVGPLERMVG